MRVSKPDIRAARLARDMGVHPRTVNRRCQRGDIPAVPIGGGRFGLTRETYNVCLRFGLDAFRDEGAGVAVTETGESE